MPNNPLKNARRTSTIGLTPADALNILAITRFKPLAGSGYDGDADPRTGEEGLSRSPAALVGFCPGVDGLMVVLDGATAELYDCDGEGAVFTLTATAYLHPDH